MDDKAGRPRFVKQRPLGDRKMVPNLSEQSTQDCRAKQRLKLSSVIGTSDGYAILVYIESRKDLAVGGDEGRDIESLTAPVFSWKVIPTRLEVGSLV